ncbi:MAG TPA: glycosyltransferase family 39 protein [Streptosporangiaceae bacterium]|nr:glycosyltransferase family 39 protein [Streptosporangiaceae bacterium]
MSQAPTGHAGQQGAATPPPAPPAGKAVPPAALSVTPSRGQRWALRAARFAPAAIPALVMTGLGIWGLARQSSMGNDEVATRWAALLSLGQLAHLLNTVDAVHGLYYLLMHAWVAVGTSPAVIRIPSVAAMAVAVALVSVLARRLTRSGWTGLFAGMVVALTPVISFYAQTARSYAMVFACVAGMTLVLVRVLEAEAASVSRAVIVRRWVAYGVLTALAGYLNEMSLLVLAAHAVTVALARPGRRVTVHWAVTSAVGAALVLPLVAVSVREHAAVAWIPRPGLTDLRILSQDYFAVAPVVALLLVACAVVAVVPTGRSAAQQWWRSGGVSVPSVAAPLLVVPAGLLLAESLVASPLYVDRYVLYGEAGAALLAAAGMYRVGRWLGRPGRLHLLVWVPGVAVCVCVLVLQIAPQQRVRTPQSRAYDFGSPARYVKTYAQPGDGVLFFGTFFRKARLGYPGDFKKVKDFSMSESPQQAGDFRGRSMPAAQADPLMLTYRRVWTVGYQPSTALSNSSLGTETLFLEEHFHLVRKHAFRGIFVTLWARRS